MASTTGVEIFQDKISGYFIGFRDSSGAWQRNCSIISRVYYLTATTFRVTFGFIKNWYCELDSASFKEKYFQRGPKKQEIRSESHPVRDHASWLAPFDVEHRNDCCTSCCSNRTGFSAHPSPYVPYCHRCVKCELGWSTEAGTTSQQTNVKLCYMQLGTYPHTRSLYRDWVITISRQAQQVECDLHYQLTLWDTNDLRTTSRPFEAAFELFL